MLCQLNPYSTIIPTACYRALQKPSRIQKTQLSCCTTGCSGGGERAKYHCLPVAATLREGLLNGEEKMCRADQKLYSHVSKFNSQYFDWHLMADGATWIQCVVKKERLPSRSSE